MDIADKTQMLLKRAEANALKAELANDPKVKQTFMDLADVYRNLAHEMELLSSLRERARNASGSPPPPEKILDTPLKILFTSHSFASTSLVSVHRRNS
jgi:hypothetical protein